MFPFFTVFFIFAIFSFIYMNKTNKKDPTGAAALLEREREANSVRKKPITDLTYITVDLSLLPSLNTDDPYILERLKTLSFLAGEDVKICDLSMYTNTELKFKYGVANLTVLTEYDQNFIMLCRCLYELGKRLYDNSDKENAKAFLEYGIKCGTDLKLHYSLLADIYEEDLEYKKIVELIHNAESVNSALKGALIRDLKSRLVGTNYSSDIEESIPEDITLN